MTDGELINTAVQRLADHQILAWFQGRMEFGPRALGNRSIFASPLNPYSTENLNVYIKRRESFRKFAASVPAELASEYFETGANARFLATVSRVRNRASQNLRGRAARRRPHSRPHRASRGQPALLGTAARRGPGQWPARALQHLIQSLRGAASL